MGCGDQVYFRRPVHRGFEVGLMLETKKLGRKLFRWWGKQSQPAKLSEW